MRTFDTLNLFDMKWYSFGFACFATIACVKFYSYDFATLSQRIFEMAADGEDLEIRKAHRSVFYDIPRFYQEI